MKNIIFIFLVLTLGCYSVQRTPSLNQAENKKLGDIFSRDYEEEIRLKPMLATAMGSKEGYAHLNDVSDEFEAKEFERLKKRISELETVRYTFLGPEEKLSYDYYKYLNQVQLEGEKFRYHTYPVNQMSGLHNQLITFMMNRHLIESVSDAEAYISRLGEFQNYLGQVIAKLKTRKLKGIVAPAFALEKSLGDIRNILANPLLLNDFKEKIQKLKLHEKENNSLIARAEKAIAESVIPGFRELNSYLEVLKKTAPKEGAAWTLPRGYAFYDYSLRYSNTTNLTADEIHRLGLREVNAIKADILHLASTLGYRGKTWKELLAFIKGNPKFLYSNDDKGRKEFLAESEVVIKNMYEKLNEVFGILPRARLEVRPVEAYRIHSAGLAFYEEPTPDGKVPGIYYVNLGNMAAATRYEMEALAYHEGIPGHHMQVALLRERHDLPSFRKYRWLSAFGEGWGLYAERLGKEMGMYTDPVMDFGRLTMDLWRAARLVVDTGLHAKKWSYKKTKDWMLENTISSEGEINSSIQRYLVLPGQATSYKIGMLKILEIREGAKKKLGAKFNLKSFHDEVLRQGTLPLSILESHLAEWTEQQLR